MEDELDQIVKTLQSLGDNQLKSDEMLLKLCSAIIERFNAMEREYVLDRAKILEAFEEIGTTMGALANRLKIIEAINDGATRH